MYLQRLKVVPSLVTSYATAGDYFQALCNIIVTQQSCLIITPNESIVATFNFPLVLVHDVTKEESSFK